MQRKHQPRWLSSLCTVNKYNAKRDYWTARTAFFVFFFFLWLHCFMFVFLSHAERNWQGILFFWWVGWLMGKGSQTKLKTEKKKWIILKWFQLYVFGLLYAVKQQYILNLTHVLAIFCGGGGIWQQLLSSETWEPETEVFLFCFLFSIIIVNIHPPLNPQFLFQGWWCRHVFLRRDRTHLNGE